MSLYLAILLLSVLVGSVARGRKSEETRTCKQRAVAEDTLA